MSTKIDIKLDFIKRKINEISKNNLTLKVGFFDSEIIKIAKTNEYGAIINVTDKMKGWFKYNFDVHKSNKPIIIPPRPFMKTTLKEHKNEWIKKLYSLLEINNSHKALDILGKEIQDDIKQTIAKNSFVPNAPFTVMKKGRNQPLIDSGKMLISVEYRVTT